MGNQRHAFDSFEGCSRFFCVGVILSAFLLPFVECCTSPRPLSAYLDFFSPYVLGYVTIIAVVGMLSFCLTLLVPKLILGSESFCPNYRLAFLFGAGYYVGSFGLTSCVGLDKTGSDQGLWVAWACLVPVILAALLAQLQKKDENPQIKKTKTSEERQKTAWAWAWRQHMFAMERRSVYALVVFLFFVALVPVIADFFYFVVWALSGGIDIKEAGWRMVKYVVGLSLLCAAYSDDKRDTQGESLEPE